MTTDARALIAEGRKHDEAMSPEMCHSRFSTAPHFRIWAGRNDLTERDVRGLHWLRSNLAALLTGYASALDEVERLGRDLQHAIAENFAFNIKVSTEINENRTSIGELKLALEQQDREVERMRTGLTELRAKLTDREDDDDDIGYWRDDIDAILNPTGAPCTTTK
jgi:hypothetical protein